MKRINILLGNFFLPLVWLALTGKYTLANFFIGVIFSSLVLWVAAPREEILIFQYIKRLWRWIEFLFFYLGEIVLASFRVVHDVLTPRHRMRPAILAIPLDLRDGLEITTLANLITMTPGTLSLDVSPERDTLYIHAMYVGDVEEFRRRIKDRYETRVKKLLR